TFVLAQMTIKPDTLPSAVLGEVYEVYLYTDPRVPIDIWEIYSGTLPPGLTLSKFDSYKGVISGTPSSPGTYRFSVKATKLATRPITIYKDYTITVKGLEIHPDTLPMATENSSYSVEIWVTGGFPPYNWNVTGLSTELTNLTWQLVSGQTDRITISGTPPIGSHGNYSVEVEVNDSSGLTASKPYLLNIKEIPWEFSVEIRRLTEEGSVPRMLPVQAVVYIDDLVFSQRARPWIPFFHTVTQSFHPKIQRIAREIQLPIITEAMAQLQSITEDIFEVTVKRISGIGSKSVQLDLIVPPGETIPLGIKITMSNSTGLVGDEAFVSIISIRIDNRYPYFSKERNLQLILRTRVTNIGEHNSTIITIIKGIEADLRVSAFPIQVLNDVEELVAGKSTIFKVNVLIICNRQPRINRDIELDVQLILPFSTWDWELPVIRTATSGSVKAAVSIPKQLNISYVIGKYIGGATIYLPSVHSYVDSYWTASYPRSIPRPLYCNACSSFASYTVKADVHNMVMEINEDNNEFSSSRTVVLTRSLKILFFPWAENVTEREKALAGRTEISFISVVVRPKVKMMVEYLQGVYPAAEATIIYDIDPMIRVRGLYQTCASEYEKALNHSCPSSSTCGCIPLYDETQHASACKGWCDCHSKVVFDFLWGPNGLAKMADDAGYDFAVAIRVVGSRGCALSSLPKGVYVGCGSSNCLLAHETYHILGPMTYDDYTCPPPNQCPEGYWVNRGEHIEAGQCYFMSACPGWIKKEMYEQLIYGWFSSNSDPMAIRVSGVIYRNGTARFDPFRVRNASRIETPGLPGNYSIILLDSNGNELSRFGINATLWGETYTDTYSFMFYVPYSKGVHTIELRNWENRVLDRRVSSANWPQVSVLAPRAEEIVSSLRNNFTISWEGRDADGDTLYYTILISSNGGESWLPIDTGLTTSSITWDPSVYDASENYVVKVIVSDGFYSAENVSSPFIIAPYVQLKVESPHG
ncbi:MAG: Ig domain-containing protein, partial [Thermoproteota archaeon]